MLRGRNHISKYILHRVHVGGRRLSALPAIQLLLLCADDPDYISVHSRCVCVSLVWYYTDSFKPVLSRETAEAEYLQFIDCDQRLSCRALKLHSQLNMNLFCVWLIHLSDSINTSTLRQSRCQNRKGLTCRKLTRTGYTMLEPSRLKWGCGLSLMTKTMSAGIVFGDSSPSRGNVILVPSFQPRLISIVRILSSVRMVLPSGFSLLREIFILLVQPWNTSSRVTLSSWMMGGSCFRRCCPPRPTWPSRGKPFRLKLVKEPKGSFPSTSMSSSSRPFALRPKNISKGLEPPKKVAKVAWGSPWKV